MESSARIPRSKPGIASGIIAAFWSNRVFKGRQWVRLYGFALATIVCLCIFNLIWKTGALGERAAPSRVAQAAIYLLVLMVVGARCHVASIPALVAAPFFKRTVWDTLCSTTITPWELMRALFSHAWWTGALPYAAVMFIAYQVLNPFAGGIEPNFWWSMFVLLGCLAHGFGHAVLGYYGLLFLRNRISVVVFTFGFPLGYFGFFAAPFDLLRRIPGVTRPAWHVLPQYAVRPGPEWRIADRPELAETFLPYVITAFIGILVLFFVFLAVFYQILYNCREEAQFKQKSGKGTGKGTDENQ